MNYIPALRYHFLTPFYDHFISFFIPEKRIKKAVIKLAAIENSFAVLDFGCGTGTLCELIVREGIACQLIGIDVDKEILKIAERKNNGEFKLVEYDGAEMPFNEAQFDRVIATWVFHHLTNDQKIKALSEIFRILKPQGKFIIADWGKPANWLQRFLFFIVQTIDNFETFKAHKLGEFPEIIRAAGFANLKEIGQEKTIFGTLYYWMGGR